MATTQLDVTESPRVEVGTYVRRKGWRLLLLSVFMPVAAAAAAAYILAQRPVPYESTLRLVVPEELGTSGSSIGLYLANLEQRLVDPEVVARVKNETGVNGGQYASGISLSRIGQSSSAEFSFTGNTSEAAGTVVETAASAALRSLAEEGLPFAKREVELAERSYDEAVEALIMFRREHDVVFPEEQYRHAVAQLEAARGDVVAAETLGDAAEADVARTVATELSRELGHLERAMPEYQQLDDARMVALDLRAAARDRLASKQAEIRMTGETIVRRDITTRQLSKVKIITQGAGVAAAVVLFLEFVIFVLPDLVRPARATSWSDRR